MKMQRIKNNKIKIKNNQKNRILNESGFLLADFIFSFVLVFSCGIIIFALTFSLATVEVVQYITWSAARAHSAANKSKNESRMAALSKFNNLKSQFPLLTGISGNWFMLGAPQINEDAAGNGFGNLDKRNSADGSPEPRHPFIGVSSELELKLFAGLKIPFLGKITNDPNLFKFQVRSFMLRNPSQEECIRFFIRENRFVQGIVPMQSWGALPIDAQAYTALEDNGC